MCYPEPWSSRETSLCLGMRLTFPRSIRILDLGVHLAIARKTRHVIRARLGLGRTLLNLLELSYACHPKPWSSREPGHPGNQATPGTRPVIKHTLGHPATRTMAEVNILPPFPWQDDMEGVVLWRPGGRWAWVTPPAPTPCLGKDDWVRAGGGKLEGYNP